ncbi:hypothetical protein BH11PSE11_BH11PSE11_21760 [soil metagenome]
MRKLTLALLMALLAPTTSFSSEPPAQPKQSTQNQDRVLSIAKFHGKLTSFQWGDYLHANFKTRSGKERSFFILRPGIDYFLTMHKDQDLIVTYEVVDQYVPEASERIKLERIVEVQAGQQRYSAWWPRIEKQSSMEKIDRRFKPAMDKLMVE